MLVVVAIATGLLVWHFTRASQAHQAIRSRRSQIRALWVEVRTFALRGIFMVIACIIVIVLALKRLADDSQAAARQCFTLSVAGVARQLRSRPSGPGARLREHACAAQTGC